MVKASEEFVPVYVDCTSSTGIRRELRDEMMRKHGVRGYPTVVFLAPDGVVLKRMCGNCGAEEFLAEMAAIAAPWRIDRRLPRALEEVGDLRGWIEARVEKLGDADVEVRERATAELQALRDALDAALRLGQEGADPERRERIRAILRRAGAEAPPEPQGPPEGEDPQPQDRR